MTVSSSIQKLWGIMTRPYKSVRNSELSSHPKMDLFVSQRNLCDADIRMDIVRKIIDEILILGMKKSHKQEQKAEVIKRAA